MTKQGYSIGDIASHWGESKQLVWYYREQGLIVPDVETSAGPIWYSIPKKPEPRKPGRKVARALKE